MSTIATDYLLDGLQAQAPFVDTTRNLPVAAIKLSCGVKAKSYRLRNLVLDNAMMPMVQAELWADQDLLLTADDFLAATEVVINGYVHGLVHSQVTNAFLTYVLPFGTFSVRLEDDMELTPFCIELSGNEVELAVDQQDVAIGIAAELEFVDGYNMNITEKDGIAFEAVAGGGAGLEPGNCDGSPAAYIGRLNGVRPDSRGNLVLGGDACLTAVPAGESTLRLDAHCPPCCRCKDFHATSRFARYVATEYAKLAQSVCVAADMYVATVDKFTNEGCSCCSVFGTLTSRFRTWPHQNFKLQAQALIQNNTKYDIAISQIDFTVSVTAKTDMSVTDENGTEYKLTAGQPVQVDVLPYSSHSHFKAQNPRPITNELVNLNSIRARATVEAGVACATGSSQINSMSSGSGYMLINTGMVITDPVFRKIVSLGNVEPELNVDLAVSGPGTSGCPDAASIDIAGSARQCVAIRANKALADQCVPATATRVESVGSDLVLHFDKAVNTDNATVTIQVLGYSNDGTTSGYIELVNVGVPVPADDNPRLELRVPKPIFSPGASSVIVYKATFASGASIHTKCGSTGVTVHADSFSLSTATSL